MSVIFSTGFLILLSVYKILKNVIYLLTYLELSTIMYDQNSIVKVVLSYDFYIEAIKQFFYGIIMISFITFTIYSIKIYSENLERNPSDKNKEQTGQRFSSRYFNFTASVKKESDVKFINNQIFDEEFLNKKQIERKTISR